MAKCSGWYRGLGSLSEPYVVLSVRELLSLFQPEKGGKFLAPTWIRASPYFFRDKSKHMSGDISFICILRIDDRENRSFVPRQKWVYRTEQTCHKLFILGSLGAGQSIVLA